MVFLESPKGRSRIGVAPSSRFSRLRTDGYGRVQKVASTEQPELLVQILVKAEKVTMSNNLFVTAGGSVASQARRMGEAIVNSGSM